MPTPVLISVIVTDYCRSAVVPDWANPDGRDDQQIIRVVVIIAVIIWLLRTFGLLGSLGLHH